MPIITVIVPIFKVEKYIRQCVDSILQQSFRDFDLVLVDDGSPDNCPQICEDYAAQDRRITVIHKKNGGLSDARNAGIDWAMENSDSQWLAFVDSDDYLFPDYLMTLYQTAQKEAADLVICDFVRVNDQGEIVERKHRFFDLVTEDKEKLFEMLHSNWRIIPAWNKLYHKNIFAQLRFAFGKIHEDNFAIPHVLWNCRRAALVSDGLYYYRQRDNSIMKTETSKSRLDLLEALIEQFEFGMERHIAPIENAAEIGFLYDYEELKSGFNKQEKRRYKQLKNRFAKAFFNCPANRSVKRFLGFCFTGLYGKLGFLYNRKRTSRKGRS